jgi:hypothetical protein
MFCGIDVLLLNKLDAGELVVADTDCGITTVDVGVDVCAVGVCVV